MVWNQVMGHRPATEPELEKKNQQPVNLYFSWLCLGFRYLSANFLDLLFLREFGIFRWPSLPNLKVGIVRSRKAEKNFFPIPLSFYRLGM